MHAAIVEWHIDSAYSWSWWEVEQDRLQLFDRIAESIRSGLPAIVDHNAELLANHTDVALEVMEDERDEGEVPDFWTRKMPHALVGLIAQHRRDLEAGRAQDLWSGRWATLVRLVNEVEGGSSAFVRVSAEGSLQEVVREVFMWERCPPVMWDGSDRPFDLDWLGRASVLLSIDDWSRSRFALPWAHRLVAEWNQRHAG